MEHIKNTDIYIIDQILKGNLNDFKTVLDVGCGRGRNLTYFLQNDFEVYGIDKDAERIKIASNLQGAKPENFKVGDIENLPFDYNFDFIICNAVLHFARNKKQFEHWVQCIWDQLNPNGILFVRTASDIGIESLVKHLGDGVFHLPDGSDRFLVNNEILLESTTNLGGELVEKIKTTNVQDLRCMTTWVVRKTAK